MTAAQTPTRLASHEKAGRGFDLVVDLYHAFMASL
jgi:hypothetical protein